MDLPKTQFIEIDYGTHKTLKAYRRKRDLMLFKDGKPVRLISFRNWNTLNGTWADNVKADKLTVRTVWTLVEVAL